MSTLVVLLNIAIGFQVSIVEHPITSEVTRFPEPVDPSPARGRLP